jgi:hypothetical protein
VSVSRYETKLRGEIGTGVLWVEYPNRFPAPLEKDMKGYVRALRQNIMLKKNSQFSLSI